MCNIHDIIKEIIFIVKTHVISKLDTKQVNTNVSVSQLINTFKQAVYSSVH